jgi:hypothetical protein
MLTFDQKIRYFRKYLSLEEKTFADSFSADILIFGDNCEHNFLKDLHTKKQIIDWIEFIKSKIVLHEHEASVQEILEDYA